MGRPRRLPGSLCGMEIQEFAMAMLRAGIVSPLNGGQLAKVPCTCSGRAALERFHKYSKLNRPMCRQDSVAPRCS